VALYVNGNLDTQGPHLCRPVSLASAPHLGSRGVATVDGAGKLSNPGFGFFQGLQDEVAIYAAPLGSDVIRLHYQTARGLPAQPVALSGFAQGNQLLLSWPAFTGGLWLQAEDTLEAPNWQYLSIPVLESNGSNLAVITASNSSQFFRLASQ
jgi:hypothetical protein